MNSIDAYHPRNAYKAIDPMPNYDRDMEQIMWDQEAGKEYELEQLDLDSLRDHMSGVLHALYTSGDAFMMESCLDEICHELGMTIPKGDPVMEKKR